MYTRHVCLNPRYQIVYGGDAGVVKERYVVRGRRVASVRKDGASA